MIEKNLFCVQCRRCTNHKLCGGDTDAEYYACQHCQRIYDQDNLLKWLGMGLAELLDEHPVVI